MVLCTLRGGSGSSEVFQVITLYNFSLYQPPIWSWSDHGLLFLDAGVIFSLVSDCMSDISDSGVYASVYDPVFVR